MKKQYTAVFVFLMFCLAAVSCGGEESGQDVSEADTDIEQAGNTESDTIDTETPGDNIESEDQVAVQSEERIAHLELCYATSINMPEDQYGPENVFDGDSATYWATMPGAAPDEGLYFSFENPIDIEYMIVEAVPGNSDFEEIRYIQVYFNGNEGAARSPGSPVSTFRMVKSVFVKVYETESMHSDEQGIRYQRDVPVAISDIMITVMGDEGIAIPLTILPIQEAGGRVEASSSLQPDEAYCPDFLFDSRPAFGWADGNVDDSGEGESLTFNFDESQHIEQIKIWNGYHRSRTHYDHNERAALISFGLEGETPTEYSLDDTMEPQIIYLEEPLDGSSFVMDFLEVYPGDVYKDLVISELRFYDGENWFVMDTGGNEDRKLELLQWAGECDAGAFIDRQIFADSSDVFNYDRQSLVIRSNGSFIIWKQDERHDSRERTYADGNWQIINDSTLRIFGRVHRLASYEQDSYDPYAGTWSDQGERLNRMTIFSDTLRFGEGWISSSRGMFEKFTF